MQYKIPQDVQRADTIIGPITFAQLGISLVGGALGYAVYISLAKTYYWYVWAIPVGIIAIVTIAFAFVKVGDMTFGRFLLYLYEYVFVPRDRVWEKRQEYFYSILKKPISLNTSIIKNTGNTDLENREKRKKLEEISKILDK
jgi:hypothetical protein